MRRLYLRIYLAVLASLLLFALIVAGAWRLGADRWEPRRQQTALLAGELVAELLPGAATGAGSADPAALQETLDRWHERARVDLSLFDADGRLLAQAGAPIGRDGERRGPTAFAARLPDGRELLVRRARVPGQHIGPGLPGIVLALLTIAAAVGVGAYPVVRRLTGRIERLQHSVDALGAGDLSARVKVEGHDEVAALAASFNRSAERIETLVRAQKDLLANASHELRSPLARIRMALALLPAESSVRVRDEVARDIAELDQLIDEILLASRLDAQVERDPQAAFEAVDLAGLCAEECARTGAEFALEGQAPVRPGDPRLLRRLVRNLLENAQRHGNGQPVSVSLADGLLRVCDRGPGVPEDEREAIFEPFYRVRGASERHGGVGLGLALARRIARLHGATLTHEPRSGGGSCFVIRLEAAGPRDFPGDRDVAPR